MYNTILRIYTNGLIKETGLTKAITLGWITEEEKAEIIANVSTS